MTQMQLTADGIDISSLIETISWSGDENQMARKLAFSYLYTNQDLNIRKAEVTYGSRIRMEDLFDGIAVSEERTESGITKSITAYDYAWYLKSKVHGTFEGSPAAITAAVREQAGITVGTLYDEPKKVEIITTGEKTIYQVITEA